MRQRTILGGLAAGLLVAITAAPAAAQTGAAAAPAAGSRNSVSGGYSFLREAGTGGGEVHDYTKGFVGSFSGKLAPWRAEYVGEFGMNFRQDANATSQQLLAVLGGVRIPIVKLFGLGLFGQALVGIERFSTPGFSERGFAFQPGGGFDIPVGNRLKVRAQGDYRLAHEEGVNFHEARIAFSLVYGIR